MAGFSLQFHALPEELLPIVRSFASDEGLHLTAIRYQPFSAVPARPEGLESLFADPSVRRFLVTTAAPDLAVDGMNRLQDQNPDALHLDLGRRTPEGLKESWLTTRASDDATLRRWRKLLNKVRGMTQAGVVAVNPASGATAALKGHRFSPGARALEKTGVPMLPAAGTARLRFHD